ncbi:hypothetical protein [Intrasporangium flavum]|uniref:hypothetical protein n=1 Tax=Intrasporangium flavum TaxID=1428657 RepID=UPI001A978DED|nr:hypothetical protein [Intrasporangium flavum]
MSDRVLALAAESQEAVRELPMPVIAYFIIAFSVFLLLLGITWSFRNTAYKVAQNRRRQHGAPGAGVDPNGPHH